MVEAPKVRAGALALLAAASLTLAACGGGGGGGTTTGANSSSTEQCQITVSITVGGGTALGTVVATLKGKPNTIQTASQTMTVPCGSTVDFAETPKPAQAAPFLGWQITGDDNQFANTPTQTGSKISVKVTNTTTIKATYRWSGM